MRGFLNFIDQKLKIGKLTLKIQLLSSKKLKAASCAGSPLIILLHKKLKILRWNGNTRHIFIGISVGYIDDLLPYDKIRSSTLNV